jgi:hypothetical protein
MKLIDVVRNDNMAHFSHFCGGNLYYTVEVEGDTYLFNISTDPNEVGTADFKSEMKASELMRWVRICIDSEEFYKIK